MKQPLNIVKKYTRTDYPNTTTIVYPYYEVSTYIPKGDVRMHIMYYSYTPTDGNAFFIVE